MAKERKEFNCPGCGQKLDMVEQGKTHKYGSPIRQCPKCARRYVDRNYHEIEIEGIRESDLSAKSSLGLALLSLVICAGCAAAVIFWPFRRIPAAFIIGAALFGIGFFVMIGDALKILTGKRKKALEIEHQQSINRLSEREYALQLQKLGYQVPEKYL